MNIELVILDMAGTTVRDDDAVNICFRDTLAAHRVEVSHDAVNAVMGLPKPTAIEILLRRPDGESQPDAAAQVARIHGDFLRRMVRYYQEDLAVGPAPYAVEVMAQLKASGIKVALDTGFSRPIVDAILTRLGWKDGNLLDATIASDEVARGRPHSDLVFKAMELTGVNHSRGVAKVGDTPSDLMEGMAAGCALVVGVTNGSHTREKLAAYPHTHLIPDLRELLPLVLASA